jgi:hypothetical protein
MPRPSVPAHEVGLGELSRGDPGEVWTRGLDRALVLRHPITFASTGLLAPTLYQAPSRRSHTNGATYVPQWSSHKSCTGLPMGGIDSLNSLRRSWRIAILSCSHKTCDTGKGRLADAGVS